MLIAPMPRTYLTHLFVYQLRAKVNSFVT